MRTTTIGFVFCLLFVFVSCKKQAGEVKSTLKKAEILLEEQPGRSLGLLEGISDPQSLKKSLYYQYYLLLIQAKYKSYKDITADTLVFTIRDYFLKKQDNENAALATYCCGRILQEQTDDEKALYQFFDADRYLERGNNLKLRGLCQNAIGDIYSKQHLKERAMFYYKKGKGYFHQAKDYKNEIITCKLIGNCLLFQEKVDSAFEYYHWALNLATDSGLDSLQASIRMNMGVSYLEKKNWVQAEVCFKEVGTFATDSVNSAKLAANFARLYALQNKNALAVVYLQKAISYLPHDPDNYVAANIYKIGSDIEENNKDYRNALYMNKQYNKYLAQIITDNKNRAVLEIKAKYNHQLIENKNKQLRIERQHIFLFFLSLSFVLILL